MPAMSSGDAVQVQVVVHDSRRGFQRRCTVRGRHRTRLCGCDAVRRCTGHLGAFDGGLML